MKIIMAQGNVGDSYRQTRHNVGFQIIDAIANTYGGIWSEKKAFRALVCELRINGKKVLLVKPTTFYNLTGFTLGTIANFYKVNFKTNLLVLHDDLSLDFGVIKTRDAGSAGGNKGLQSIISQIGIDFHRVKIGIDNDQRHLIAKSDFVLSRFNREEQAFLPNIINQIHLLVQNFLNNDLPNCTYKLIKKEPSRRAEPTDSKIPLKKH